MSRSLHSEVVQEHCLAGLDVIALAGEEVYSRLGLPSQGIDPSTVSRIETAAMSKEEGLAPRRTHAPHSERLARHGIHAAVAARQHSNEYGTALSSLLEPRRRTSLSERIWEGCSASVHRQPRSK